MRELEAEKAQRESAEGQISAAKIDLNEILGEFTELGAELERIPLERPEDFEDLFADIEEVQTAFAHFNLPINDNRDLNRLVKRISEESEKLRLRYNENYTLALLMECYAPNVCDDAEKLAREQAHTHATQARAGIGSYDSGEGSSAVYAQED